MEVQVEGAKELRRNLRKVGGPALNQGMKLIHEEIAKPVAARARIYAPKRSGTLRSKIKHRATITMAQVQAGPLIYAPIIEFGGYPGDYQGEPYVYRAIDEMAHESLQKYQVRLNKWLDQVWQDFG